MQGWEEVERDNSADDRSPPHSNSAEMPRLAHDPKAWVINKYAHAAPC